MKQISLLFLRFYQLVISPFIHMLFGHACRFTPTCSEYAHEAIEKYGLFKGGTLSVKRILKCNPLNKGGYDPLQKSV